MSVQKALYSSTSKGSISQMPDLTSRQTISEIDLISGCLGNVLADDIVETISSHLCSFLSVESVIEFQQLVIIVIISKRYTRLQHTANAQWLHTMI